MMLMLCSQVVGLAYPAYATCKALDQQVAMEKSHWLCYWLAFGGLTAVEILVTQQFPGYYHLKFLLLLWLQSRRYQGARRLYTEFVRPLVRKLEPRIDPVLTQMSALKVRTACFRDDMPDLCLIVERCTAASCAPHTKKNSNAILLSFQERSDIKAIGEQFHDLMAKIPVLEWFVRQPGDESSVEMWLRNLLR